MSRRALVVKNLGANIPYAEGLRLQRNLSEQRRSETVPDTLLLLEHSPVYTLGRSARDENLLWNREQCVEAGIEIFETDRGGDITYHGPGQLVGYPIVRLAGGSRDVLRYVRKLEECLIRTAVDFNVPADRDARNRGIWVGNAKLAALGVRVSTGITTHGFAINVNTDLSGYNGIVPCGIRQAGVTSLARVLDREINLPEFSRALVARFGEVFDYDRIREA